MLQQILKHWFTGKDNETYDVIRFLIFCVTLVFIALAIAAFIHTHTFDMQSFGIGSASIVGGGGAGLGFKSSTEPGGSLPLSMRE